MTGFFSIEQTHALLWFVGELERRWGRRAAGGGPGGNGGGRRQLDAVVEGFFARGWRGLLILEASEVRPSTAM